MAERINLGREVRELRLGSTFNSPKPRKSFHTLKYDFKPASIDLSKTATLDVTTNNQVTVTMPHLDSSGIPKTVFKGNQRNYTKECVLIIDKVTGQVTLEKLHHNIQVKKTRSETNNKASTHFSAQSNGGGTVIGQRPTPPPPPPPPQPQQPPQLLENNTQRVSNKTRVSTGLRKKAMGPFVQRHSPIQSSPSYPHHKSPQQAPAWNANNAMQTLPSIPLIGMDDHFGMSNGSGNYLSVASNQQGTSYHSNSSSSKVSPKLVNNNQPMQSNGRNNSNNSIHSYDNSTHHKIQPLEHHVPKENVCEIGVLSATDSSDSSDSGSSSNSDSDSDDEKEKPISNGTNSLPTLLDEDLQLSSNSSDSDN